jgi:hypothetical protein
VFSSLPYFIQHCTGKRNKKNSRKKQEKAGHENPAMLKVTPSSSANQPEEAAMITKFVTPNQGIIEAFEKRAIAAIMAEGFTRTDAEAILDSWIERKAKRIQADRLDRKLMAIR